LQDRQDCRRADVIILGAGMAGASLAAELAGHRRVLLLEMEDRPGRHATGRSAAMFFESYGNPLVRALTRASRAFLEQPPGGFTDVPLLRPRGALFVADAGRVGALDALAGQVGEPDSLRRIDAVEARRLCPILRPGWVAGGVLDETGHDMDVAALHQGYLRLARRAGAQLVTRVADQQLWRANGDWVVASSAGTFVAPVLVNATGAWADAVARQAGVRPIGLQPLRRTAVTLSLANELDSRDWPMVVDVDEQFYFKPDAGNLLLSPADEIPSEPCDAVPDELEVAIAIDRFEAATSATVRRLVQRWAGLRSFVADRSPVAGLDPEAAGFFWLAGQGGYGIQMAPALARAAAAVLMDRPLPADLVREGVTKTALSVARLRP